MNKENFKTWLLGKLVEMGCENTLEDRQEIKKEIDKMVAHEIAKIGIYLDVPEGSEFWYLSDKYDTEKIAGSIIEDIHKTEVQKETERFLNANKTLR